MSTASDCFPALLVQKGSEGRVWAAVHELATDDLPPGNVLVQVAWSSLNYKDALAVTGHPGVVRKFPHVPGIDAAGKVVESRHAGVAAGDQVLITGYDLGAGVWGGYAGYVRVPGEWVIPLPAGLSLRDSMVLGTAGLTAALSLEALLHHGLTPAAGELVVTGASGSVGCLAVSLLARAGFSVAAVTGKPAAHELLRQLGAARLLTRDELRDPSSRPLLSARYAGGVDTVGGTVLSTLLRSCQRAGCVAACGLVGGAELPITVYPFILRGITLCGIDSAECPREKRLRLWHKLAGEWKPALLDELAQEATLSELPGHVERMLRGEVMGRVVVRLGC